MTANELRLALTERAAEDGSLCCWRFDEYGQPDDFPQWFAVPGHVSRGLVMLALLAQERLVALPCYTWIEPTGEFCHEGGIPTPLYRECTADAPGAEPVTLIETAREHCWELSHAPEWLLEVAWDLVNDYHSTDPRQLALAL